MEITEKVKRKTTLKKKIIHEREKNDFQIGRASCRERVTAPV